MLYCECQTSHGELKTQALSDTFVAEMFAVCKDGFVGDVIIIYVGF